MNSFEQSGYHIYHFFKIQKICIFQHVFHKVLRKKLFSYKDITFLWQRCRVFSVRLALNV